MRPAARWLLIALVTLAVFFSRQSIFTRIGTTVNAVAEKNGSLYLVLIGEAVFTAGVMFALWAFQQSDPVIVYMKY